MYDTHMHTHWSGDSEADPRDMIAAARKKQLSGITFTDHLDWDYRTEPGLFDLDLPHYCPTMRELATSCQEEGFRIRVGIELGLQPHLAARHRALLEEYDFDFCIGSIHQVDGEDPYYDACWEGKSISEAYRHYFQATLDNLNAFFEIDALGHLDYISRYGMRVAAARGEDGTLRLSDYLGEIDAILHFLIRHNIALEVNTGSFRYGYPQPNPSAEILSRYHELGGRLLTLGADAHKPADVAIGFDRLPALLKDCGFDCYYVYDKRQPVEVPLE